MKEMVSEKRGLKTGFAPGKEGFTGMKYEGNSFRKSGLKSG